MKAHEIRSAFLAYFQKNGHSVIDSSSLVPSNDPTLLFTNAGMVQFKDVFLGNDPRPYTRATTSQKCVRAGGKHNDLENVGFTARHHTLFEMLGNFSFGDYFKKEAIHYAWEFTTQVLKLPKDKLYVSVFREDDEAAEIWHKQEGVPLDRIFRFGEKDNFWSMGDTGPCGPCSELFIDRGPQYAKPECATSGTCTVGCDCDRYLEFWNLVFMQFNRDASGKMTPLPKPSVDTGAGLERLASILQNVPTNYDTDLFRAIISKIEAMTGKPMSRHPELRFAYQVVADHARATAFLISDGVMPANEGRGYVLRRIMRRAVRFGKQLGLEGAFLHKVTGFVIDQMKDTYPSLETQRTLIDKATLSEEEQFLRTLERGLQHIEEETRSLKKGDTLPGPVLFKLYDTFGFPPDLTRVICEERGIRVDESGFEREMAKQKEESRKNWKGSGEESIGPVYQQLAHALRDQSALPEFVGYDHLEADGKCLAILKKGASGLAAVDSAQAGDRVQMVFSKTPFYGESGGQSGDHGQIFSSDGSFRAKVVDAQRPVPELTVLQVEVENGAIRTGQTAGQKVDTQRRALTAKNHTATHLLHWALRSVLGTHVKQAGSVVTPELLRFDFSHFAPLTGEELTKIETLINTKISEAKAVAKQEMDKDAAVAKGAIAFFGEKYGAKVRVVSVGDYSVELCGGTHVDSAGDIHFFKIVSESGIAAGVRRIVAYTSQGAFQYLKQREEEMKGLRDLVKASSFEEVGAKIEKLLQAEKEARKEIEKLQSELSQGQIDRWISGAIAGKSGTKLMIQLVEPHKDGMKYLRDVADLARTRVSDAVVVVGMKDPTQDKVYLLSAIGAEAQKKGLSAQEILKPLMAHIDGKGGGKADLAQCGGTKTAGLGLALEAAKTALKA